MKKKVIVGMSGGIDSSVTAILLQKAGYEVEGVYMKLHDKPNYHEENFSKVEQVASSLGIKAHFLDLSNEFKKDVYDYFVSSYKEGLTPNPCIVCNRSIKFGKMLEYAKSIGADFIATGHYVRCDGKSISEGVDKSKDQSYFLAQIDKNALPNIIFPLGGWVKEDVKEFAKNYDFLSRISSSNESLEICFVENTYLEVLAKHMNIDMEGETIDSSGKVVGTHKGYMHYTIGKRRGFFVNGAHDPHFVLDIKPELNQIVVGKKEELEVKKIQIKDISLISDVGDNFECNVKVRYRTNATPATVSMQGDKATIIFKESVFGVARGQIAALYDGEKLLGGGVII
ncbi:MAG: tRNA 2-thiouridine(34) synthase MnmA [Sulfurovaceae bacterium]|nr:tRNA 2-thiouridine(34) synthase MnmA [Sulfurovaceae bacterium]MDD5549052.1 tRNA 2-thiouridine(34) synthase MnmA [Sulfurovaceae bacterium]